jgi:hypothetical protein
VQYAYTEMAGGANNSRQTSLTYPNGRVLGYTYASGVDNAISRLSSITDGATTLESYSELGLDTIVKRAHPQSTYDQTFIKYSTDSNGDAGDQYIGLDRFGRVADQRWMVSSTGTTNDRYQYGFDRDGNVLFRSNLSNHSYREARLFSFTELTQRLCSSKFPVPGMKPEDRGVTVVATNRNASSRTAAAWSDCF